MGELAVDDAMTGVVVSPRVEQIIRLERQGDDCQWEAARLISEELAEGKSQRQLAGEISKSQPHVSYMAKTWGIWGGDNRGYHSFDSCYHSPEVRGGGPKPPPLPEPSPRPAPQPRPLPAPGDPKPPPAPVPRERSGEYIALAWQNIAQALGEVTKMGEPKWSPQARHAVLAQLRAAVTALEKEHE